MALTGLEAANSAWRPYWAAQAIAAAVIGVLCAALVGSRAWLEAAAVDTEKAVAEEALKPPVSARVYRTPQF